jgi:hypothetical protein
VTLENGKKVEFNLDSLNQTKNDPKVGALIFEEMQTVSSMVLFTDYCEP